MPIIGMRLYTHDFISNVGEMCQMLSLCYVIHAAIYNFLACNILLYFFSLCDNNVVEIKLNP